MPTEKELIKEYESLKQRKDNKIFNEICCLSLVEEEYNGEDLPVCLFSSSSFQNEYLTIIKFLGQIKDKIIYETNYEGKNPDELFLNLNNNYIHVYQYKTVEEFVQKRLLEEEHKKAEQKAEYEQYLTLKEKYDS